MSIPTWKNYNNKKQNLPIIILSAKLSTHENSWMLGGYHFFSHCCSLSSRAHSFPHHHHHKNIHRKSLFLSPSRWNHRIITTPHPSNTKSSVIKLYASFSSAWTTIEYIVITCVYWNRVHQIRNKRKWNIFKLVRMDCNRVCGIYSIILCIIIYTFKTRIILANRSDLLFVIYYIGGLGIDGLSFSIIYLEEK